MVLIFQFICISARLNCGAAYKVISECATSNTLSVKLNFIYRESIYQSIEIGDVTKDSSLSAVPLIGLEASLTDDVGDTIFE